MRKSRTYEVCEEIIEHLVDGGYTYEVSRHSLTEAITWIRGGDPRTIQNWIRNLRVLGFIEIVSPNVFKLNLVRYPKALEKAVKVQGQKKLM